MNKHGGCADNVHGDRTYLCDLVDRSGDTQHSILNTTDDLANACFDLCLIPQLGDGFPGFPDNNPGFLGGDERTQGDGSVTVFPSRGQIYRVVPGRGGGFIGGGGSSGSGLLMSGRVRGRGGDGVGLLGGRLGSRNGGSVFCRSGHGGGVWSEDRRDKVGKVK